MEFLTKIRQVLMHPSKFFEYIKKESFQNTFFYFLVLALFSILMIRITSRIFHPWTKDFGLFESISGMGFLLFFIIFWIFVLTGILFVWIFVWRGKGSLLDTFKILVYSKTPVFLFGWIPYVGFLANIYTFVLLIIATSKLHKISVFKSALIYIIPLIIFALIILIAFIILLSNHTLSSLLAIIQNTITIYR